MKPTTTYRFLLTALAVLIAQPLFARETSTKFEAMPFQSSVRVDGTSNVHDWHVKGIEIGGQITFKADVPPGATVKQVREAIIAKPSAAADVTIRVKSLESGKKDMDKKMYGAMNADSIPTIQYQLKELALMEDARADQEVFDVWTSGTLTINNVARELKMPMRLTVVDGKHLRISGETAMKMTDYKVKPPTALLGAIRAGDQIKVRFEWNVVRAEDEKVAASAAAPAAAAKK
jgi:hypothetical protein